MKESLFQIANNLIDDMNYIKKVIDSCKTITQLNNCRNLIKNYENKYKNKTTSVDISVAYLNGYVLGTLNGRLYGENTTH